MKLNPFMGWDQELYEEELKKESAERDDAWGWDWKELFQLCGIAILLYLPFWVFEMAIYLALVLALT